MFSTVHALRKNKKKKKKEKKGVYSSLNITKPATKNTENVRVERVIMRVAVHPVESFLYRISVDLFFTVVFHSMRIKKMR